MQWTIGIATSDNDQRCTTNAISASDDVTAEEKYSTISHADNFIDEEPRFNRTGLNQTIVSSTKLWPRQ